MTLRSLRRAASRITCTLAASAALLAGCALPPAPGGGRPVASAMTRPPAATATATATAAAEATAPAWLFPVLPLPAGPRPVDDTPRHVPGSDRAYTLSQLYDLFGAPDWFPGTHAPMPDVVAHGRAPDVMACGYCHLPDGRGRPENAMIAGLPAGYIAQQVSDLQAGMRRALVPGYRPTALMIQAVAGASDAEIAAAARYFAAQRPVKRVRVSEAARVPRARPGSWPLVAARGTEPLGERLLEYVDDDERHRLRDPRVGYVAYVPRGSLARGALLALRGEGTIAPCASCHGDRLQGVALIPPLAGRSPGYLLRQLYAFRLDARSGETGLAMIPVAKALAPGDLIAVAAYAASLEP